MDYLRSHQNGTAAGRIPVSHPGWTTPARGIRIRGDQPLSHRVLTEGALLAAARTAVACDLTAAHLWSMVVPSGFGLDPDAQASAIATPRGGTRLRAKGLRGRRLELPEDHVTEIAGIPATTPARTWIDCAPLVRWTDLVAMGDAMLRASLATHDDLTSMVIWGRGRRGIRLARAALEFVDPLSESPGESWVRAVLIRAGLPRPVCNLPVTVLGFCFRLDLAWPDAKVAVEYDGQQFHGPERQDRDAWRRRLLRDDGWTVITVRKEDLRRPSDFIDAVTRALSLRAVTTRRGCAQ